MDTELAYLKKHSVSLVLDVGANIGQTGQMLRREGYLGRIISFEPISVCFEKLAKRAAGDPLWQVHNTAVGAEDGRAQIGVSENFFSSSILEATDELIGIFAPIRYTRHEDVPLTRLDTVFDEIVRPDDVVHLKIDTQGFERFVIDGARGTGPDRVGAHGGGGQRGLSRRNDRARGHHHDVGSGLCSDRCLAGLAPSQK